MDFLEDKFDRGEVIAKPGKIRKEEMKSPGWNS
jgi:hypothetical protein